MVFQYLECSRQQDIEPRTSLLFVCGFFVCLGFFIFLFCFRLFNTEMWNCSTRQKSKVRIVSTLVVMTHTWMSSWPLTFASDLLEKTVHMQEDSVNISNNQISQ